MFHAQYKTSSKNKTFVEMVKRLSEASVSVAKKARTELKSKLSEKYIFSKVQLISEDFDQVDYLSLNQLIELYDLVLPKFANTNGLEKYEGFARYLNIQLLKIFEKLFHLGKFNTTKITKHHDKNSFDQLKELKKSYELYKFNLLFHVENISEDCSLIVDGLDIYMKLLKLEGTYFASPISKGSEETAPYFPNKSFRELINAMFKSRNGEILQDGTNSNIIIQEFLESYYRKYADIQFYFIQDLSTDGMNELKKIVPDDLLFSKFLTIMREPSAIHRSEEKTFLSNLPSVFENKNHYKAEFQKKWLHFLSLKLSLDQYKTILLILHKRVIPHFKEPTALMDFLTDSYDIGGIVSILSLNGLFELIKSHNLDYPNFYQKLYSLFDKDLLHVKYRSRFLRLTDIFLSSTHLPSSLVASFIKKAARLSLNAAPGAIVSMIPFIYNLIKKHPTCMVLLQNTDENEFGLKDSFDDNEQNPLKTEAIKSSLWEMETLSTHYHPNVATLAKIFSQPFRKQSYNMEDFLDWSYVSLLEAENTKKLKKEVALEFETFNLLLGEYIEGWEY